MLWGGKLLVETILRQTRTPSSVHSQRNGINCLNSCWIMLCKVCEVCGRGSLVVKVTDSWSEWHQFESSIAEDVPCRRAYTC
ncbi:hypothetical protein TNCV_5102331 [Trichonephila clavipes]|nr:hypothetical protein TNCV_5102331 [Trichonephila clavipes]